MNTSEIGVGCVLTERQRNEFKRFLNSAISGEQWAMAQDLVEFLATYQVPDDIVTGRIFDPIMKAYQTWLAINEDKAIDSLISNAGKPLAEDMAALERLGNPFKPSSLFSQGVIDLKNENDKLRSALEEIVSLYEDSEKNSRIPQMMTEIAAKARGIPLL